MRDFGGRVIDGPMRGKDYVNDCPMFRVARYNMPSYASMSMYDPIETVPIHYVEYRWVYSLGEWAMVY